MQPSEAREERKRRRRITGVLLVVLFGLIYWPGGPIMEQFRFEVLGWPFFALWTVVIAPLLILAVFGYNAYMNIKLENEMQSSGGGE